jgi:fucose 4-O-acetylase-like acetyltransferase
MKIRYLLLVSLAIATLNTLLFGLMLGFHFHRLFWFFLAAFILVFFAFCLFGAAKKADESARRMFGGT